MTHTYRSDIDGLRTIAVFSVVIFHAFPNFLTGGFIGVDIFFVISGFLITGILKNDIERGEFSLLKFYERRIRRLFPALLLVIFTTLFVGWYVLIENEFRALGKHILAATGFVSNLVLWSEAGYFDTAAKMKPFLHLWSLGIEEQYYIVIPLLLAFLARHKFSALKIISILLILSFAYNIYLMSNDATAGFYNPFARAWELLAGSLLALLPKNKLDERLNAGLSITGIGLLTYGVFNYYPSMVFPGYAALLPVLATSMIIYAGNENLFNRYIVGNKISASLGLISYPLYLWHWPILVLYKIIKSDRGAMNERIGLVLLALVLAILTYRFIEKPLKKKNKTVVLSCLMASLVVIGGLIFSGTIKQRLEVAGSDKIMTAITDFNYPVDGLKTYGIKNLSQFIYASKREEKTLYIGDSTMQHYAPRILQQISLNPEKLNSALFATYGGCLPIINIDYYPVSSSNYCGEKMAAAFKLAQMPEVTKVVISGNWYVHFNELTSLKILTQNGKSIIKSSRDLKDEQLKILGESIAEIAKHKKVYLVSSSLKHMDISPFSLIEGSRLSHITLNLSPQPFKLSKYMELYGSLHKQFETIARENGAILLDPLKAFCKNDLCPIANDKGEPYYKDDLHIRPFAVKEMADFIDQTIQPLK